MQGEQLATVVAESWDCGGEDRSGPESEKERGRERVRGREGERERERQVTKVTQGKQAVVSSLDGFLQGSERNN